MTTSFSMKKAGAGLAIVGALLFAGAVTACRREPAPGATADAAKAKYHCPMHPTYVSDKPGQCPICKMDLVPIEPAGGTAAAAAPGARKILYYRSPMDPSIHSSVPRKDEMGMDYVPVYADEAQAPVVAGRTMVALSPERRQMLGVRSEPVTRRPLQRTIRTVGRVAMDERRVHHVHTKYEAYVEELYVNFVGQQVRKGEPLAALYSPELVATQQEYLLALRAQEQLGRSGVSSAAQGGRDLLQAARQRLLFWDMAPRDIEALERTGKISRNVKLYAEHPGFVINKTAVHGMRVTAADTLFDIADLSGVWILADVYETDVANVAVGMNAAVSLPYQSGRTWNGQITYVNPLVDPATRTIKVRIEVPNADTALKPEMFTDVLLQRDLGTALFVPESAVLRSGEQRIVFLDRGDGRLEPREIAVGDRVEGGYAVVSGLTEGERVVTSANFLIDSESSLKAALSGMGAGGGSAAGHQHGPAPGVPAGPAPAGTHGGDSRPGAGTAPQGVAPRAPARPAAPRSAPGKAAGPVARAANTIWYCPMDTEVVSNGPGSCPKCKMDLVPRPESARRDTGEVWYCPMDTEVVSDGPGSCAKCGMDLVKKEAAAKAPASAHQH